MMPMLCDILKFEHFLTPGTIILSDGRSANIRFLLSNFQRNWFHIYKKKQDVNKTAKWEAASAYARQHKLRFRVVSEEQLFHQGTRK